MHFIFPRTRILVLSRMYHHTWAALSYCRSAYRGVTRFSRGKHSPRGGALSGGLHHMGRAVLLRKGRPEGLVAIPGRRASYLPRLGLPLGKGRGAPFLRCGTAPELFFLTVTKEPRIKQQKVSFWEEAWLLEMPSQAVLGSTSRWHFR